MTQSAHETPKSRQHRSSHIRSAAGAVGLAVAMTIIAPLAIEAHADPGVDWTAIAECESGNNIHANTGNGYYGLLQFSLSTWRANGGTGMPNQASREQQIAVANHTLATQGIGAWPTCGRRGYGGAPAAHAPTHQNVTPPAPQESPSPPVELARWESPQHRASWHGRRVSWRKHCHR